MHNLKLAVYKRGLEEINTLIFFPAMIGTLNYFIVDILYFSALSAGTLSFRRTDNDVLRRQSHAQWSELIGEVGHHEETLKRYTSAHILVNTIPTQKFESGSIGFLIKFSGRNIP